MKTKIRKQTKAEAIAESRKALADQAALMARWEKIRRPSFQPTN